MRYEFNIQPEAFEFQTEVDETARLAGLADVRSPPPLGAAIPVNRRHPGYVAWVQSSLNLIRGPRLKVDGVIGPQTRSIVRAFQQQRGLTPDGIVGLRTEAALRSAGAPPLPWERRRVMLESEASQWQSELTQRPGCVGLSGIKYNSLYFEIWLDSCMVAALTDAIDMAAVMAGICGAMGGGFECTSIGFLLAGSRATISYVNNWGGGRGVKIFVAYNTTPFAIYPQ
jgi:putative peptidoglycan binding protein